MEEAEPSPQILSPCSSGRRSTGDTNSPEFEFWMIRNPCSFPQPNLLTADELFSDGVLLPLHHLHLSNDTPAAPPPHPAPYEPESSTPETAEVTSAANSTLTSSKRWMDIFKKSINTKEKDDNNGFREKRREKKNGGGGVNAAELNINIWPFSRSRSAGNGGTRPRPAAATRKVSSAPCSRSNSAGESKSRKWPSSPSRGGVHLGRSSPVWQVRRSAGGGRSSDAVPKSAAEKGRRKIPSGGGGSKARVLSLNVPMCIGYRQHLGCRSDHECYAGGVATSGGGASGEGVRGSNLFNIRSMFSKKVH